MTFPGCHSEQLRASTHAIFLQIHKIVTLLVFLSFKLFVLGLNKICIHGSFRQSPTWPKVWNFHTRAEECVRYMFSFYLFCWFHKLWRVLYFHIVWCLGWKISKSAILPARQNPRSLISSLTSDCFVYQVRVEFFIFFLDKEKVLKKNT